MRQIVMFDRFGKETRKVGDPIRRGDAPNLSFDEHRIALTLDPGKFNFRKAGEYKFTIEQNMREDPLQNVMNIGLRLEKKPQ